MSNGNVLIRSVKRDEATEVRNGLVLNLLTSPLTYLGGMQQVPLPADPPAWWSVGRDVVLRNTIHQESLWASAIAIAISQQASQSWDITGGPHKRTWAQQLLIRADGGNGWHTFLAKHLRDYLTTDNGAFVEIIRASTSPASKIVGLAHLDSLRCTRTGDPDVPVIYRDQQNNLHELRRHQVFFLSDMPDPGESWFGVGLCAASRAYREIRKLSAITSLVDTKVSGRKPLALHFVSGLSATQLDDILSAAKTEQQRSEQEGQAFSMSYMGAIVTALMGQSVELVTVPLAELPAGFERKEEWDVALYTYADALGIDFQDLAPLTGAPLGTGAQSRVLDDKARGKGLALWRQQFMHALNWQVYPDDVDFAFGENDLDDRKKQADYHKTVIDSVVALVEKQVIAAPIAQRLLIQLDVLPKDLFPEAQADDSTLSDTEKPEAVVPEVVAVAAPAETPAPLLVAKAIDAEVEAAAAQLLAEIGLS